MEPEDVIKIARVFIMKNNEAEKQHQDEIIAPIVY